MPTAVKRKSPAKKRSPVKRKSPVKKRSPVRRKTSPKRRSLVRRKTSPKRRSPVKRRTSPKRRSPVRRRTSPKRKISRKRLSAPPYGPYLDKQHFENAYAQYTRNQLSRYQTPVKKTVYLKWVRDRYDKKIEADIRKERERRRVVAGTNSQRERDIRDQADIARIERQMKEEELNQRLQALRGVR